MTSTIATRLLTLAIAASGYSVCYAGGTPEHILPSLHTPDREPPPALVSLMREQGLRFEPGSSVLSAERDILPELGGHQTLEPDTSDPAAFNRARDAWLHPGRAVHLDLMGPTP